jgi:hypothetical protein
MAAIGGQGEANGNGAGKLAAPVDGAGVMAFAGHAVNLLAPRAAA